MENSNFDQVGMVTSANGDSIKSTPPILLLYNLMSFR